jgi:hypothetical protein
VVAQARRQQQETDEDPAEDTLSARLRKARQDITAQPVDTAQDVPAAVDDQAIEDDLARRRARLSQ